MSRRQKRFAKSHSTEFRQLSIVLFAQKPKSRFNRILKVVLPFSSPRRSVCYNTINFLDWNSETIRVPLLLKHTCCFKYFCKIPWKPTYFRMIYQYFKSSINYIVFYRFTTNSHFVRVSNKSHKIALYRNERKISKRFNLLVFSSIT